MHAKDRISGQWPLRRAFFIFAAAAALFWIPVFWILDRIL
jgi:hypothetical protein